MMKNTGYGQPIQGGSRDKSKKASSSASTGSLKLEPGDVLVYFGRAPSGAPRQGEEVPSHIAMVGQPDKYGLQVIHNTINSKNSFAGAVKHLASSAIPGYLNLPDTRMVVYRCVDRPDIAEKAAYFGETWVDPVPILKSADFATAGAQPKLPERTELCSRGNGGHLDRSVVTFEMNPWLNAPNLAEFRGGKSPYSAERLASGQQLKQQKQWDILTAFRAVKAYVRTCKELGLSPRHGTSCDQFVMFAYQAASLEALLGGAKLDDDVIELVASQPKNFKLYLKEGEPKEDLGSELGKFSAPAFGKLKVALELITGNAHKTGFLPQAIASDAKTSSVDKLFDALKSQDSGFKLLGDVKKNLSIDPPKNLPATPSGDDGGERKPSTSTTETVPSEGGKTELV